MTSSLPNTPPDGPGSFHDIFQWAHQYIGRIGQSSPMLHALVANCALPILMVTDYSGIGGAELALATILHATTAAHAVDTNAIFWASCDILTHCRSVLTDAGPLSPLVAPLPLACTRPALYKKHKEPDDSFLHNKSFVSYPSPCAGISWNH